MTWHGSIPPPGLPGGALTPCEDSLLRWQAMHSSEENHLTWAQSLYLTRKVLLSCPVEQLCGGDQKCHTRGGELQPGVPSHLHDSGRHLDTHQTQISNLPPNQREQEGVEMSLDPLRSSAATGEGKCLTSPTGESIFQRGGGGT